MYEEIEKCRICGNTDLVSIIHLGNQSLTGVFPKTKEQNITSGPIELVKCREGKGSNSCGLVQLKQSYDPNELYGSNYGYRSALNQSMIAHLHGKVKKILDRITLVTGDIILDIGSNDSTLLQAYPPNGVTLVGIDAVGQKFEEYYSDHIQLIPEFFSAKSFKKYFGEKKAKIVTSIAMFYDLEDPLHFMRQIESILADDGNWHFEQSYLPFMLQTNAYDTICHEHLGYYALEQIKWMTDRVGLKIISVEFNQINGGSFGVTVAKHNAEYPQCDELIQEILKKEQAMGLCTSAPYQSFRDEIYQHREELLSILRQIRKNGNLILGYGASTKGNVILQFCGIDDHLIPTIADVNEDKFGCFTPETHIPIISEREAKAQAPDYFFVLPWHFRENFIAREQDYLKKGGKLLFPLPQIEVVGA